MRVPILARNIGEPSTRLSRLIRLLCQALRLPAWFRRRMAWILTLVASLDYHPELGRPHDWYARSGTYLDSSTKHSSKVLRVFGDGKLCAACPLMCCMTAP